MSCKREYFKWRERTIFMFSSHRVSKLEGKGGTSITGRRKAGGAGNIYPHFSPFVVAPVWSRRVRVAEKQACGMLLGVVEISSSEMVKWKGWMLDRLQVYFCIFWCINYSEVLIPSTLQHIWSTHVHSAIHLLFCPCSPLRLLPYLSLSLLQCPTSMSFSSTCRKVIIPNLTVVTSSPN